MACRGVSIQAFNSNPGSMVLYSPISQQELPHRAALNNKAIKQNSKQDNIKPRQIEHPGKQSPNERPGCPPSLDSPARRGKTQKPWGRKEKPLGEPLKERSTPMDGQAIETQGRRNPTADGPRSQKSSPCWSLSSSCPIPVGVVPPYSGVPPFDLQALPLGGVRQGTPCE
jgi:hypothetical protein